MAARERPRECPNLLLVEGEEDLQVIPYLMEANGIAWDRDARKAPVWIEQYGGYSNILEPKTISSELKTRGLKAMGIIVDADENALIRWQELKSSCKPSIPNIPEEITDTGLIHTTADGIRFGVWMMPDNRSRGMLETFLACLIPVNGEPLWNYAQEVTSAAKKQGAPFIENHRDKANIHTWLAWQKPPGQRFRDAMTEKIFEPLHPQAQSFVAWFKKLYVF